MNSWTQAFTDSLAKNFATFVSYLPGLLLGVALLVVGWILAKLLAVVTSRVLQFIGFDRLLSRTTVQVLLERVGTKRRMSELVGLIGFWLVFLLFLISAAESAGLTILSEALTTVVYYLPRVAIAILILVIGLAASNFVRELIIMACRSAGLAQGTIIAQAFYVAAMLLVIVTAINQLGINTALLDNTIILLVAGLIGGAALSFGLGSRKAVANLIAAHYLRSVLHVGMNVKIGNVQGTIVAMTPVSVVVDTREGRVIIPASQFDDTTAMITNAADPEDSHAS
ncbi:MAG: hypothetical protein D6690_16505 [Nitrospirae bacterium]|nr:MAG: hypothetical protein D6690_16505 [Nitrospirota bacterium]